MGFKIGAGKGVVVSNGAMVDTNAVVCTDIEVATRLIQYLLKISL